MIDSPLERFHLLLVEALRERSPSDLERPFTVAEIYQDLVPYRTHRDRLGVEMNGDYEHVLLRLLSGEGGYLELESDHALAEIREELDALDPNTGLYREFAAVDVRLAASSIPDELTTFDHDEDEEEDMARRADAEESGAADMADADAGAGGRDDVGSGAETVDMVELGSLAQDHPRQPAGSSRARSGGPEMSRDSASALDHAGAAGDDRVTGAGEVDLTSCRWCRQTLPDRENLHYCPFCGQDVRLQPCRDCGEALEPGWKFCIACGTEAEG